MLYYDKNYLLQLLLVGCRGPWLKQVRQRIHMDTAYGFRAVLCWLRSSDCFVLAE